MYLSVCDLVFTKMEFAVKFFHSTINIFMLSELHTVKQKFILLTVQIENNDFSIDLCY